MSASHEFALLNAFRSLFEGTAYLHRKPNLGDFVASHLYEDLVTLNKSTKLVERVTRRERVVNLRNKTVGKASRRGDGTFGELVPTAIAVTDEDFWVARGNIAILEIGAETKILAKAMIKQIDRVITDLCSQVQHFRKAGGNPITVAFVGINWADKYVSFEKDRVYPATGKGGGRHPAEAEARLIARAKPSFFEFQILRFRATNIEPFPFEWVNLDNTREEYSSVLTRISREYDRRFP